MSLPANSTFLPVLDDLLSPDLRPVLQTPTAENGGMVTSISSGGGGGGGGGSRNYGSTGFANVISTNAESGSSAFGRSQVNSPGKKINFKIKTASTRTALPEEDRASRKIQHWWRAKSQRRHSTDIDIRAERAKHTIRHNRTEDHILYLETEVSRLKSALSAERKARSLQMDAIRCLWSQVQQMSSAGSDSVMTQSMPNGFSASPHKRPGAQGDSQMSVSFAGFQPNITDTPASVSCTSNCSKEIQLLRESMSTEISQLREMLSNLRMGQRPDDLQRDSMDVDIEIESNHESDTAAAVAQRPFSLNILGMTQSGSSQSQVDSMETPEITEFAGVMARNLLEEAVESEEEARNTKLPVT